MDLILYTKGCKDMRIYMAQQYKPVALAGEKKFIEFGPRVCGVRNEFACSSLYSEGPEGQRGVNQ